MESSIMKIKINGRDLHKLLDAMETLKDFRVNSGIPIKFEKMKNNKGLTQFSRSIWRLCCFVEKLQDAEIELDVIQKEEK